MGIKKLGTLWNLEPVRYLAVGVFNTLNGFVSFALTFYLVGDFLRAEGSLFLSYLYSATLGFFLNRSFVFSHRSPLLRSYLRYHLVYLVPLVINAALLTPISKLFDGNVYVAQASYSSFWAIATYFAHKFFSFRL
jgi:putative flippase GtrA